MGNLMLHDLTKKEDIVSVSSCRVATLNHKLFDFTCLDGHAFAAY